MNSKDQHDLENFLIDAEAQGILDRGGKQLLDRIHEVDRIQRQRKQQVCSIQQDIHYEKQQINGIEHSIDEISGKISELEGQFRANEAQVQKLAKKQIASILSSNYYQNNDYSVALMCQTNSKVQKAKETQLELQAKLQILQKKKKYLESQLFDKISKIRSPESQQATIQYDQKQDVQALRQEKRLNLISIPQELNLKCFGEKFILRVPNLMVQVEAKEEDIKHHSE